MRTSDRTREHAGTVSQGGHSLVSRTLASLRLGYAGGMVARAIRASLRQYESELRALVAGVESDVAAGRTLSPALRLRLQTFVERLNRDLLGLYERERAAALSPDERDLLLPVVEQVRDLLRSVGATRNSGAAAQRLRSAAAVVSRS
jgi:hypothetical protein